MEARKDIFTLKTICLISGASKGYGQCVAVRFAELFPQGSLIILIARNEQGLKNTSLQIRDKCTKVRVKSKAIDLSIASKVDYEQMLSEIFTENGINKNEFEQSLVVHNAGSLGDVSVAMSGQTGDDTLQRYWRLNLTSFTVMNAVWHQFFKDVNLLQRVVIGITSICALQPFKSWGIYCAGKAARDMLLHTFAEEEPEILVLNYAPGPIDTDMQFEARTYTADRDLKEMFKDMKSSGKLLSPDESVSKFIKLLKRNTFESGAHIDYYDIE